MEMADTPFIDKGGYALLGNDDFLLDLISGAHQSEINDYVAFILHVTQHRNKSSYPDNKCF